MTNSNKAILLSLAITVSVSQLVVACGPTSSTCEELRVPCPGDGGASTGGQGTGSSSTGSSGNVGGGGPETGGTGTGGAADPCDACTGDTPFCNGAKECVACLVTPDCTDPTKSVCGKDGSCEKCVSNEGCAHLDERTVCDGGTCVECTIATEAAKCGGKSCNPATKTCTNTERSSLTECVKCVADSECYTGLGYACVPMLFNGAERDGGYCLKKTPGCAGPYGVPTVERVSLSGATAVEYCGVNEAVTTCEAVIDLVSGKACSADTSCGASGFADGLCEIVNSGASTTCTVSCASDSSCPADKICGGAPGSKYCGG